MRLAECLFYDKDEDTVVPANPSGLSPGFDVLAGKRYSKIDTIQAMGLDHFHKNAGKHFKSVRNVWQLPNARPNAIIYHEGKNVIIKGREICGFRSFQHTTFFCVVKMAFYVEKSGKYVTYY